MLQASSGLLVVDDLGTLVNRVEGLEVEQLDASTSVGGITDGASNVGVSGIMVFGMGGISGEKDDVVLGEGSIIPEGPPSDGQLGSEGTGLIRGEDSDGSQFFNGGDMSNIGHVLGEL